MKFKLNVWASVVSYNSARTLIAELGYAMYRESDDKLVVIVKKSPGDPSWQKVYSDDEIAATFYVDQGLYTSTLDVFNGDLRWSYAAEELIDFSTFLKLIVRTIDSDFQYEPSPYMGRGRSKNHYIQQSLTVIRKNKKKIKDMDIDLELVQ